jgi:hypothetical protein
LALDIGGKSFYFSILTAQDLYSGVPVIGSLSSEVRCIFRTYLKQFFSVEDSLPPIGRYSNIKKAA